MHIGVIGGGQLARMIALAGLPMGLEFSFLVASESNCVSALGRVIQTRDYTDETLQDFADAVDVVTYETENLLIAVVEKIAESKPVYPNVRTLRVAQQRSLEAQLFQGLSIPSAKTKLLCEDISDFKTPFFVKRNMGGFDGRGQWVFTDSNPISEDFITKEGDSCIIQESIAFTEEVSCISVHAPDQSMQAYSLCHNQHQQQILRYTLPQQHHPLMQQALQLNQLIANELDYVGVLTVEYFVCDNQLIANEIAPRVHNSGHWTIDACATSQFENHLRAVCGFPLGSTEALQPSLMVNIIGQWPDKQKLLQQPGLACHDYQKTPEPKRKLGHVTITGSENIKHFVEQCQDIIGHIELNDSFVD